MVLATSVSSSDRPDGNNKKAYCEALAAKVSSDKELPSYCLEYAKNLQKKSTSVDPFEGMRSGSAVEARKARARGYEPHAVVQRRLTNQGRRFSKLEK